jgi:hypothetical protein
MIVYSDIYNIDIKTVKDMIEYISVINQIN